LLLRDGDLSRGTISTATALGSPLPSARAASKLPKVLVITPFLPYPLSHGGAVRIYNLCRALAGRVDFALAAVREKNEAIDYQKLHEIFGQVYAVDVDELPSKDSRSPRQVRQYRSRSLRALIASVCRTWNPDLVQVEYTQLASFREAAPQTPALLVEHDVTFSLYRQLAAANPGRETNAEYDRWLRFESHWLGRFDAVWTVSEEDRGLAVHAGSQSDRTFVIPNGVDTSRYVPREEGGAAEILYVGSFRHFPNVMGFDKLRREIMPHVWNRCPEARLRVVAGPGYENFWRQFSRDGSAELSDQRITVHGFVEDLRPLYATATAVVAPLDVSAGTNIKVLEAMACGRAVITTPAGCAGLGLRHRHDAMICADAAEFGDAVCELLASSGLRSQIASAARRTAEDRFSWTAIAEKAYGSYLDLIPAGKKP
jgi:glycosyltransferase involved in cell wall biosynthesis